MSTDVSGKRVAVIGGGVEGAASARWLLGQGATVTVHDAAEQSTLGAAAALVTAGAAFVTGPDYLDGLDRYDLIVRSPGVPFQTPPLQAAIKDGGMVTSQTKLFFERCPAPIIGITGTKGKGTTATLLRDMLEAAEQRVFVGGNIGRPPFEFLDDLQSGDTVILELSSFQLQDLEQSPHVAVVTNLGQDHMDHHTDTAEYHAAKQNLLKFQTAADIAILNADDPGSQRLEKIGHGQRSHFGRRARRAPFATADPPNGPVLVDIDGSGGESVVSIKDIPIPGPHNLSNVMAAALAARQLGATPAQIKRAVIAFQPLPYHLQPLGVVRGVKYVNDSYSTGPTSTIPALESFDGPVILIAGGFDKGLDYGELADHLQAHTKAVILIPPAGDRIAAALKKVNGDRPELITVQAKEEIFPALATRVAPGDTVLLSPAAASFGWFNNYQERGAWFSGEVAKLEQLEQ